MQYQEDAYYKDPMKQSEKIGVYEIPIIGNDGADDLYIGSTKTSFGESQGTYEKCWRETGNSPRKIC